MGKRLSGLQKWYFNIVEQCPFFLRGEPVICLKNLKFLMSLIFFEKYLDMMFNNVLNGKKRLPWLQKGHFNSGKMSIFSKGLARDFRQKFENSSQSYFLSKRPRHDVY